MTSLSREDLAAIRARAEAATPGPWDVLDERDLEVNSGPPGTLCIVNSHDDILLGGIDDHSDFPDADAAHIAGMDPATTIALLDTRAEAATQALRDAAVAVRVQDVTSRSAHVAKWLNQRADALDEAEARP